MKRLPRTSADEARDRLRHWISNDHVDPSPPGSPGVVEAKVDIVEIDGGAIDDRPARARSTHARSAWRAGSKKLRLRESFLAA